MNHRLRSAIQAARNQNMPKDTIDRAVKKGTGELGGNQYEEMVYEGYGPGGVALLTEAATDNKNRTAAEVRSVFSKNNGNMAGAGSVAHLFTRMGEILTTPTEMGEDVMLEIALEASAEELAKEDEAYLISTAPDQLYAVADNLKSKGIEIESQKLTYQAGTLVSVEDAFDGFPDSTSDGRSGRVRGHSQRLLEFRHFRGNLAAGLELTAGLPKSTKGHVRHMANDSQEKKRLPPQSRTGTPRTAVARAKAAATRASHPNAPETTSGTPSGNDTGKKGGRHKGKNSHRHDKRHENPDFANQPDPGAGEGIIEISGKGFGFLRDAKRQYAQSPYDIFVTPELIRKHELRDGMMLHGETRRGNRGFQLAKLLTVNGEDPAKYHRLPAFEDLKAVNPTERIRLETVPERYSTRVIDMMTPIGKGQRGLIVAPPRTGKTTLLEDIAVAVSTNNEDIHLIIMLIDERPEEVTELRRAPAQGGGHGQLQRQRRQKPHTASHSSPSSAPSGLWKPGATSSSCWIPSLAWGARSTTP